MKVLLHFNAGPDLDQWTRAQCGKEFDLVTCPEADETTFLDLLPEIEVIWHVLKPITPEHLGRAPRLRLIHKLGVGVNTIALDEARRRQIAVCNSPGSNSRAVAEMALLLMLAALRRLGELTQRCREPGGWALPDSLQQSLTEIGGRTVGLIGFGAVPAQLAPWLAAIGATVVYFDLVRKPAVPYAYLPLDDLFSQADIVSLHLPLTAETDRLVNASRLKRMKPGAVLINTARGGLVDETALADALEHGPLAAAGLDVFADEPVSPDNRLLKLANVIATPHAAWLTRETLSRCILDALENTRRLQRGEPLHNRVV